MGTQSGGWDSPLHASDSVQKGSEKLPTRPFMNGLSSPGAARSVLETYDPRQEIVGVNAGHGSTHVDNTVGEAFVDLIPTLRMRGFCRMFWMCALMSIE